jgi:hypothetical protein
MTKERRNTAMTMKEKKAAKKSKRDSKYDATIFEKKL